MTGKRVLYQEPQATFFHDVMTNLFTDKITKAATYYNLHPSNSELMSWGNNAPKIKDLLQLSGVTDTYVTFEYLVPYNMKRIDCILYGRNSQNQGNVVRTGLTHFAIILIINKILIKNILMVSYLYHLRLFSSIILCSASICIIAPS